MMKNLYRLFTIMVIASFFFTACSEEEADVSTITSFEDYTVVASSVTQLGDLTETNDDYIITLEFDEKQITNLDLFVQASSTSGATEGEDFVINTKEIEVEALTSGPIEISISVLEDYTAEENESIVLTFVGEYGYPRPLDVEVGTIMDNGLTISPNVDITLRWEFDDPDILEFLEVEDVCEVVEDFDITIQVGPGSGDDLLFAAATLSCPESGSFAIADMVEGTVYDVWIYIFAGKDIGELGDMTAFIDFGRSGNSAFNGTAEVSEFNSATASDSAIYLTIERNGDVVTLKDLDGNIIAMG